jgi:hypothetical protein
VAIEFCLSHRTFVGCPIDGGLISTNDLVMEFDLATEFGLPSNKM